MTSGRGFSEDMRLAHVLADQADSISLDRFKAQDLTVDTKPDLTPVTDADRAVEEMLRITLSRARTRDAVMGEEFGTTGHGPRRWVLDPIDGTKNFVRGVPVWATLISLFDGDEPVVGLVSAPALNKRWWAAKDVGAWTGRRLESATRCRVSEVTDLSDASLSYSSLSGWEERGLLDGFLDLTRSVWRTRAYGDFWSYCLLAEGAVDIACEPEVSRLGPRRARRHRPRGRRPVHRPLRCPRARAAAARWPPTASCTTPRSPRSVRPQPRGPRRPDVRRARPGTIPRMTTPIGREAQRPNPALEPLSPLLGEWRTTGTHPLVPGTTFHGRTSFAWHEGGAFVVMRSEIDEPEIPDGVAIIGSDDAAGTFTMIYFDERDISRRYIVEAGDGEVSCTATRRASHSAWSSPSPATATDSTPRGRCRTTAAPGRTTCS